MTNVKVKCAHCGFEDIWKDIEYHPMAVMANASPWCGPNNKLAGSGTLTCDNCGEDFLYKFVAVPTVMVAKLPEYI